MSAELDVSIIIVSYNVSELLDGCLASITRFSKHVRHEVIVVDSASSDDSVAMVRAKHPEVVLLACTENVGFSRGNNLGLGLAKGRHILYLNPDTELVEDALTPLLAVLDQRPEVGIVGPKLLNTDRSHQSSIGQFTSLETLADEYIGRRKMETIQVTHPVHPTIVPVLLGACLLVRGDVVRKLGGFDERYFMYNEETDLCLSFQEEGLATLYVPEVSLIHHGSKSASKSVEQRQRTYHINRTSQVLFCEKHYGFRVAILAKLLIACAMLVRIPLLSVRAALGKTGQADWTKVRYYTRTLRWLIIRKRDW